MRLVFMLGSLVAALLAGCATPLPPGTAPGSPAVANPPAVAAPTLADEQHRLAEALAGTPVTVDLTPEGRLRVQVPAEFSFDVGRAAVKPPLAAVLDRVAPGLKARASTEIRLSAPADPKGAGGVLLAQDRAASVRDYLVARGIAATRFGTLSRADHVELLVGDKSAAR